MTEKQSFMRVDELKSLGYLTISGRVNRKFFYEKLCYGEKEGRGN